MSYIKNITGVQQLDFQINRILTYGKEAADKKEILENAKTIENFNQWFAYWLRLGKQYENTHQSLRAAYAYRLAEFFLKEDHPQKNEMYLLSIKNFYLAFEKMKINYEIHNISYMDTEMHSLIFRSENEKGVLLVCGGYDSFIEEFVPALFEFINRGYTIILFEGNGQGKTLKNGLTFIPNWEKPTSCVLDYYGVQACTMVGISWGGYLAVRAAAYEKRIKAVAAYDVLENGFLCMTNVFPGILKIVVRWAIHNRKKKLANKLLEKLRTRSLLADWVMMQGMYITGKETPYDFYRELLKHQLPQEVCNKLDCDILLLAGDEDHYIPKDQLCKLKSKIHCAKSLTTRVFTKVEGGEQHCQVGNHKLAVFEILDWLQNIYTKD